MDQDCNDRVANIYHIDTKMFGFTGYSSAYIVEGKEIALIDTGMPTQTEAVRAAIKAHGFSISDISYIFLTHCEHPYCGGNVAPFLRDSPKARVYNHPIGAQYLINPDIEERRRRESFTPQMATRFSGMEPVSPLRINYLNDGDVFDLGNGMRLKTIFAPGHQPSGIIILEEKSRNLFINDLAGLNLADIDVSMILTSPRSDAKKSIESLNKIMDLQARRLLLCHFGIWSNPEELIKRALNNLQHLLDIGEKCMAAGKPSEIATRFIDYVTPEVEKTKPRGEEFYGYVKGELVPVLANSFSDYIRRQKR